MSLQQLNDCWNVCQRIEELRRMLNSGIVTAPCWITFLKMEISELSEHTTALEVA
ncbi:hypothetical protein D3C74_268910 [compost metagenome]